MIYEMVSSACGQPDKLSLCRIEERGDQGAEEVGFEERLPLTKKLL